MTPDPFPSELVEAAACAITTSGRRGSTDQEAQAYDAAYAVLAAVVPLIEQRVIDRLAGEAGENPYRDLSMPLLSEACKIEAEVWDAGAACGVAAAQEREGTARLVADHWRKAMLDAGDERMPARAAAHPLCMVLAALDGETRPEHLGITPESDEWHVLSAALADPGAAR